MVRWTKRICLEVDERGKLREYAGQVHEGIKYVTKASSRASRLNVTAGRLKMNVEVLTN
jgi:hypothetical protein